MKVRLATSSGELVTFLELPEFKTAPDVIVWGSRFFHADPRSITRLTQQPDYKECFAYYVPGSSGETSPFGKDSFVS